MMDVMYQADGVGLASTQVGIDKRFSCTIPPEIAPGRTLKSLWQTRTSSNTEQTETDEEGCLSSRSEECAGRVTRSSWIWVEYQDEEGRQKRKKLKGFEARVFQHEYDHIEGVLHFDRSLGERSRADPADFRYVARGARARWYIGAVRRKERSSRP